MKFSLPSFNIYFTTLSKERLVKWLGERVTFSGKISFPSKVPGFLHVLFNLVEKHSPVSFLGLNALVQLC